LLGFPGDFIRHRVNERHFAGLLPIFVLHNPDEEYFSDLSPDFVLHIPDEETLKDLQQLAFGVKANTSTN
jgi:hypothetical protein